MEFDFEKLREDLKQDCYGTWFVGGYGGALIESFDLDQATHEELIRLAQEKGINMNRYYVGR